MIHRRTALRLPKDCYGNRALTFAPLSCRCYYCRVSVCLGHFDYLATWFVYSFTVTIAQRALELFFSLLPRGRPTSDLILSLGLSLSVGVCSWRLVAELCAEYVSMDGTQARVTPDTLQ